MRFGIHHLLLLAPMFPLNTYLFSVVALPPLRTYRYQHEVNSVRHVQDRVETSLRYCSHEKLSVTDETINQWLAHRLPKTDPASESLEDPPRMDSWGNPYQMQPRKSVTAAVRVYSTGRDGDSQTDGDDPDDIRSWDENRGAWYSNWHDRRELGVCMVLSAFLTPFVFWVLTNRTGFGIKAPTEVGG